MSKEKKFICWYAYKGMETEGNLRLEEPVIIEAADKAEAMWKWHHKNDSEWGRKFFNNSLDKFRKEGQITGWRHWCKELAE